MILNEKINEGDIVGLNVESFDIASGAISDLYRLKFGIVMALTTGEYRSGLNLGN